MKTVVRKAVLCGVPVSVLLFTGAAAVYRAVDLPVPLLRVLAALPVLTGIWCAACAVGRTERTHLLRCGIASALLLTAFWYAAAAMHSGALLSPALLAAALPCGAAGAVRGAMKDAPQPRPRLHRLIPLRTRLLLLPLLLHTPERKEDGTDRCP